MFTIGSFCVILDDRGRVLLCHRRDRDAWNLPGGGVESGELPTEAAVRETKEETGLEVVIERLVGIYVKSNDDLDFSFTAKAVGGQLTISDEADACQFFEIEKIPLNMLKKQYERVVDALKPRKEPLFKHQ